MFGLTIRRSRYGGTTDVLQHRERFGRPMVRLLASDGRALQIRPWLTEHPYWERARRKAEGKVI